MRPFRRRPRGSAPGPPEPGSAVPAVEVAGVEEPFTSPYEFRTADGVPVRLHDMNFLGLDYLVTPRSLTLRFAYTDPLWTPREAADRPVAVFRFSGVLVWEWADDADSPATPAGASGQVADFCYYRPTNVFQLGTTDTSLMFSAARLVVSLEPLPESIPPS